MAKLSTLQDGFTGASINAALWNSITGTTVLDQVNDLVTLAQPTVSGTTNSFGSTTAFDATGSAIYAEVGTAANGNGGTGTLFKVSKDTSNWIAVRLLAGVFSVGLTTAGTTVATALPAYDPNAHGWWRISESGGSFLVATSADGYNWSTLATLAYSWSAVAVTFAFQAAASVTEVAGNVATIQHINTMAGGPFNINWPLLEEAWAPRWNCNGGSVPQEQYCNLTPRTEGSSAVTRGRQYELDTIQAGTASLTLQDKDGVLDPNNAAGPYFGHIQPYQPYRKRAQWPPTRNLLSQVQATAGDLGGWPLGPINATNSGPAIHSSPDSTNGSFVASATAWQGGTVMQCAVTTSAVVPSSVFYTSQVAITPGLPYSGTLQVRNITASTTISVQASMRWVDDTGSIFATSTGTVTTLTGSPTAGWTAVTLTATAPANAAAVFAGVLLQAAVTATCSVQADGWQLEQAAVPSTWACPGVWNPIYGGFAERYSSSWDMGGTYGLVKPTAVDATALLSQVTLKDPLSEEIGTWNPTFLYTLGDPAGSGAATDQTGKNPAAPVAISKYGSGSLAFGGTITAANPVTGIYTGSSNSVATFANPSPGQLVYLPATYISLTQAGIKGPANPLLWTRMVAFRYTGPTPAAAGAAMVWGAIDNQHANGSDFSIFVDTTGRLSWRLAGPTSGAVGSLSAASVVDSNWHLAMVSYDAANSYLQFFLDGVLTAAGAGPQYAPSGIVSDAVGSLIDMSNGASATDNFAGDISFVGEFPTALPSSGMSGIYTAWKNSCAGESTDARYARILRYAGYLGIASLQAGQTTSMGPAVLAGEDALTALQGVVDTENGAHFADRSGNMTFRSRAARYNALTPMYTFGERTDLGEWPYEDDQHDFDPTHISNLVTITQASTGQLFTAQDTTSQNNYFPRTLQRTINASSALECQDAANYLLSRCKTPSTRVSSLVLHPSANPAMWPVCLSLELGMRIRVMRRPPAAPPIQVDCFIEKIDITNDDGAEAFWTLQCSPVDITPYATFAAFHTTLNATISSGVGSITINNGADNANPCAGQIGGGQQLVLGLGTANQETVTVSSVATTTAGWATCVITLTANTTKGHTAGDIVCEPLPAGVTSATTWDSVAMLDSAAFAY